VPETTLQIAWTRTATLRAPVWPDIPGTEFPVWIQTSAIQVRATQTRVA